MSINKEIENLDLDLSELSSLELMAKRNNVKNLLSNEVKKLSQRKNDLLKQLNESQVETNDEKTSQQKVSQTLGSVVVSNYMWDQNNDFVKIYIEIDKNYSLEESTIQLTFANKRNFSIVFGKYKFTISKLNSDIDKERSYYKLTKSGKQLIIYLKKESQKQWTSINEVENAYKKALDEEKDELSADPSAGLMKLMKKMYDEGDDDMKRTIAKSWYESRQKNAGDMTAFDKDMDI